MRKIILTKKLNEKQTELLNGIADLEIVNISDDDKEGFSRHIKDAEGLLLSTAHKLTAEDIENARNLKVVSRTGAGVDNVDVAAATKRDILVLNTPEANSISVAEHAVTLMAAISKQILFYDAQLRKGNFRIRRTNAAADMDGRVLGLIGCGRIARFVADKCRAAFGMQVIGYDPYIKELPDITLYEKLEEVFKKADYISLHLPLTDETQNMVGERLLSLMKPTAFIINTARGGIIDEHALAEALKNGMIAGAALDVLESEPPAPDNPLMPLPNVILTPHSAALTRECAQRVADEAVLGLSDYLQGRTPKFIFNR